MTIRAGVAGVGNLGKTHLRTLMKLTDRVSVDALADPMPERSSGKNLKTEGLNLKLAEEGALSVDQVRSYDDYRAACTDAELDLVCIATPSDLHAAAAILALEHGKHVFTEKPMALNVQDCHRMIAAAKANGRMLMVGQVLRFYPQYMAAKRLMDGGAYGRVLSATMTRYGRRPGGWFAEHERSGGVKLDLHIHDVDAALYWWGEPDDVDAHTVGSTAGVSAVLSRWKYNAGPVVQIEALWDIGSPFGFQFRIVLEQATLSFGSNRKEGLLITTKEETRPVELDVQAHPPHAQELVYFIDCVLSGTPPARCLPEESALAVQYATR